MIKLIKSTFYHEKETKKALCKFIMDSAQLSLGSQCDQFEKKFAQWQGCKYSVLFNSGSSANLALIQSLLNLGKLKTGDLVGFSSITWATNVMPLMQLGLNVLPIEVELDTLNVSLKTIEMAFKKNKFRCLFITNLLGFGGDLAAIKKFCKNNNIILLEDNCESLGSESSGIKFGNFSFASTASFFVGHHMSMIEGGAVCTNDLNLYMMLKMVRSHGWDRHLEKNQQKIIRKKYKVNNFYSKYTFYDLAYNIRPTEIQGFIGLNQLKYLDEMIEKREKNYNLFLEIYNNSDFIKIEPKKLTKISNFAFPVVCKTEALAEKYVKKCLDSGIEVRPIVGGLMTEQPFYKKYGKFLTKLPNASKIHKNGFYFGNNPEMTLTEIKYIINVFKK